MESSHTNFDQKYQDLVQEKNFYRLLLSVKTDLRKLVKKDTKEYFNLLIWSVDKLKEDSENESCNSIFIYAIEEFEKNFNKSDAELCLDSFKKAFSQLNLNCDKTKVKHRLLKFFESKNFSEILLSTFGFYEIFARDALSNKDIMEGYRYALKAENLNLLFDYVEEFKKNQFKNEVEYFYFIARTTLELILIKNLELGFKFITKFVNVENDLQNNHPVINFAYLLTALLCKDASNFDNFWAFINIYKPIIDVDGSFGKYLNKISTTYFNKTILQEESGMNIMNLLKAFS